MTTLIRSARTAVEAGEGKAVVTRLREAFVARLRGDANLVAMHGGDPQRILRRPSAVPVTVLPLTTYFDFGVRPDPVVPLEDRTFQLDVWGRDPDENERIAERAKALLHNRPLTVAGCARGVYLQVLRNLDRVADDGDLIQTTREFRLLTYERS